MELDRETVVETVAAVGPVLVMIGVLAAIGLVFGGEAGGLTPTGGKATVGAIVLFILALTGIGVYLSTTEG